jgi:hypothetical protein
VRERGKRDANEAKKENNRLNIRCLMPKISRICCFCKLKNGDFVCNEWYDERYAIVSENEG